MGNIVSTVALLSALSMAGSTSMQDPLEGSIYDEKYSNTEKPDKYGKEDKKKDKKKDKKDKYDKYNNSDRPIVFPDFDKNRDAIDYFMPLPSENNDVAPPIPHEEPEEEYSGEWEGAYLKRIPAWGGEFPENYINFEWPTQEIFDQMRPDVKLESLNLKATSY